MLSLSWRREPPDVAIEYLPTNGTAVIQGETSSLAQDLIGQLGTQLEEPIAQLKRLTDSFDVLSAQWTDVGRNVNLLVEPRTPDAVDGDEQVGNLASMVARADERMAEMRDVMANMNRTLEGLQSWIEDDEFRADAAATVSNARALTENLNEQVTVLSRRYVAVADDLARAINTMEQTLELARTGEGTVGKLLNDPALYDNLNDASQRLNLAMDELNLLLEKFRTEGLPLQFE
jgi:methyl-accepting chemotaxis protein